MENLFFEQCRPFVLWYMKKQMIHMMEGEKYLSLLRKAIREYMSGYDASNGNFLAYLRPYLLKEFLEASNSPR